MDVDDESPQKVVLYTWDFDNWSTKHWEEKKAGNVDETRSWIQVAETEEGGLQLSLFRDKKEVLVISADIDQWGTWIGIEVDGDGVIDSVASTGIVVAQQWGTMSFLDALIAGLTEMKRVCNINTKPPIFKSMEKVKDGEDA